MRAFLAITTAALLIGGAAISGESKSAKASATAATKATATQAIPTQPANPASAKNSDDDASYQDAMRKGAESARLGDGARALAQFKTAVELQPRSAEALFRLALTYSDLRMFDAAESNARKATILDPQHSGAWLVLGSSLFYEKREKEAKEPLENAFRLNPGSPHAPFMLGRCYYFGLNDKQKSVEYFRRTLELDPDYAPAHFMEGCALYDLDMLPQARISFASALKRDARNPEYLYRAGLCVLKQKQYAEAERLFRDAVANNRRHWQAYYSLAELSRTQSSDTEQAAVYYRNFLETAPTDAPGRAEVEALLATLKPGAGKR